MANKSDSTPKESDVVDEVPAVDSLSQAEGVIDVIEKNRLIIISSSVGLIGILLLVLVGKQLGAQRHLKAGQEFTAAAAARDLSGLDQVIETYKGSVSAGNAMISKADIQIDQGKPQDAISTLNEFINDFSEHPRYPQAFFMLANLYHSSGDLGKAKDQYQRVLEIQKDGELSPISRIRLGDIAMAEGDEEKARQNYEESFKQHPGNPFYNLAQQRIDRLRVGNPPEVDRPEPPQAPSDEKADAPAETSDAVEETSNSGDGSSEKSEKATIASEEPADASEPEEAPDAEKEGNEASGSESGTEE